ncbi:MAG: Ribosomal protein S12 methylthiotransferase RimO [Methanoregula sp. PtaU1.Bin006]|jgi:anaerobic magnesium-protoporphyrin IX monomethyl ester cyclase|uniref:B12-binding domain-containing radical SAM protein n=1 Tax=Methanoregula sp. PtaU1.Bin006 TaxID=1811681 RepID=UPI0009CC7FFA|nr:radical SAM protein [Methanoregula sp. PtaU1.Bin006]OPY35672.1 MAG: Ribosomal protein S12 methylthiotransferase RimO [Methanoregula sp. PtaU1.Bin006]
MAFKRILLVKPPGRKGLGFASDIIPIGLEYIAASIEDIVDEVNIIDMELEQSPFYTFLDDLNPDLVAITMSATDHYEGLHIAKIAKEKGCTTVLGGYHPTAVPDELLSHPQVDLIVRGEGEDTMKTLVQEDSFKDVPGLSYKVNGKIVHNSDRPLIQDLDALPFPARHLRRHEYKDHIMFEKDRETEVITMSRGCWGRCSFCCEPMMCRGHQRFRSPENVMKELLEIVSFHKGRPLSILVTDPNFMGSPKRVDRLCDLLHQYKLDIRFSVLIRADSVVRNPELIEKMCENGILSYEMGIESPKAEDLKNIQKNITVEMQEKAVKILGDNGAWAGGTLVIGLPGQTEEEITGFPLYAREIGLTGAAFGVATPFPGTEFYRDIAQEGLIVEPDWSRYDEMHSVFELKSVSRKRLEELATYCHARFWTLDMLIEQARFSLKSGRKVTLENFIGGILNAVRFGWNTTMDLQTENLLAHWRIAADAGADPCVEEYTREVGVHNIIEFPPFLFKVLGEQTIQFTIKSEGVPITSYIIKTTAGTVEYVKAVSGRLEDMTINLDVDLNDLDLSMGNTSNRELLKNCVRATISLRGIDEIWYRTRLIAAIGLGSTQIIIAQNFRTLKKAGRYAVNGGSN